MVEMSGNEFELAWDRVKLKLSKHFKVSADYEFILFIIGMQELGQGIRDFSRNEKMDLISLARCRLLLKQGYLKETGVDGQGWPMFEPLKSLNSMMPSYQTQLIKKGVIDYFEHVEFQ